MDDFKGNLVMDLQKSIGLVRRDITGHVENFVYQPKGLVELYVAKFNQIFLERQIDTLEDVGSTLQLKCEKNVFEFFIHLQVDEVTDGYGKTVLHYSMNLKDPNDINLVLAWMFTMFELLNPAYDIVKKIERYHPIFDDAKGALIKDIKTTHANRMKHLQ